MKNFLHFLLPFLLLQLPSLLPDFPFCTKKASDVYLPVGSTGQKISLLDLSKIDVKAFETLSGRHLNFFDRLGFKLAQKKLRKSINADGTIDNKKLNKFLAEGDHSTGFHLGGLH